MALLSPVTLPRRNIALDAEVESGDLIEDWDENEMSYHHFIDNQVEWFDVDDLNLDATYLSRFSNPFNEE